MRIRVSKYRRRRRRRRLDGHLCAASKGNAANTKEREVKLNGAPFNLGS